MPNRFFSVEKKNYHKIFKIFGVKFKVKDMKQVVKFVQSQQNNLKSLTESNIFLWSNKDSLTSREKLWFIAQEFYREAGYFPDLKNPKSFNEKINWMKLNYYNPIEKDIIDKYEFKNYIKEKLGEGYTIPAIGIYDNIYDINFDLLPNQYVIKTTANGCHVGVDIIKNKKEIDVAELKLKYANLTQEWNSVYYTCLSRGYKDIKPRILIEEYIPELEDKDSEEYKIFCFHGEPKLFYVANYKNNTVTYYDINCNKIPVKNGSYKINRQRVLIPSRNFERMLQISKILSKDFPFVRVDFYSTKDKIYVGEMTFTPTGGFAKYQPRKYDYIFGEYLDLTNLPNKFVNVIAELRTVHR